MLETLMSNQVRSFVSFTLASLFFTAASTIVKYVTLYNGLGISYIRFLIGFVFYAGLILITKHKISLLGFKYVSARGVFNALAVMYFYQAILMTTVAEGNVLNMTFPIFIAFLSPLLLKERTTWQKLLLVFTGFIGIYLVINPQFGAISTGHWYGLLSGIAAAVALIYLRGARSAGSDVVSILFWVNLFGLITLLLVNRTIFFEWDLVNFVIAAISAISAMLGQVCITYGYRYADATTGGILLISRIPMAIIASIVLFQTIITLNLLVGSAVIITVLILLALLNRAQANK